MQRFMRQRKPWPKREAPGAIELRCGKRVLRATQRRRQRGQDGTSTKKQLTPRSLKRKHHISPTSSANSVVGENDIVVCQAAHKGADKFKDKGLDHYDLLQELCVGSLATGAFSGFPSSLGGPTLEQERDMLRQGKPIRPADRMSVDSRGKRKSDGTGGSGSKSIKIDEKSQAYATFTEAQQQRIEYYASRKNPNANAPEANVHDCVMALDAIKSYVSDEQFFVAYDKLIFGPPVGRLGFLSLSQEQRVGWVERQ